MRNRLASLGLLGAVSALALMAGAPALAQATPPRAWGWGPGMMGHGLGGSIPRHRQARMGDIPPPYDRLADPLPDSGAVIDRGMTVFMEHCESCHGVTGGGDGPAAQGLSPRPANLAWLSSLPLVRWDPFMYWAIAEGGKSFGTAMPAFKDTLSDNDIWAAITYIRAELRRPDRPK